MTGPPITNRAGRPTAPTLDEPGLSLLRSWLEPRTLGRSRVQVARLGVGLGAIHRDPAQTRRLIDRAVAAGIRYIDVAPSYGRGIAEERLGQALDEFGREQFAISTKSGFLLREQSIGQKLVHIGYETLTGGRAGLELAADRVRRGAEVAARKLGVGSRDAINGADPSGDDDWTDWQPAPLPVCDFSYDGAMLAMEESLERLDTDRVEVVFLHNPDVHRRQAMRGAYRALEGLRRSGTIGAIGVSMNDGATLAQFADEGDFDAFLLGGRYTLLDQSAATSLFPVTTARKIGLLAGGVFNGGLLADPAHSDTYNWRPVPPETRERAIRIADVCKRHGASLKAAALQFTFAHPAIASLVLGPATAEEFDESLRLLTEPIAPDLWVELEERGYIDPGLPRPSVT